MNNDKPEPVSRASGRFAKWVKRLLIVAGTAAVVLVATGCVYNAIASKRLAREISETPREPETGTVKGIGPLSLNHASRRGVLLLHGYIGSPKDFGDLPNALRAAGFRVSAPLLPGHGTKPTDMKPLKVEELMSAVREAYLTLRRECDSVAIVGFSMGGSLAIQLVRDPELPLPEALVLASPHFGVTYRWYGILPPETWARMCAPLIPNLIKGKAFVMLNRREAVDEIYSYDIVPTRSAVMLNTLAHEVRKAPLRMPAEDVLVVYSAGDHAASPSGTRKVVKRWGLLETSQLVLTRSNHHIFHDYDREAVIENIVDFLSERRVSRE